MSNTQKDFRVPVEGNPRGPNVLALLSRGVNAARLLSVLSALSFFSFAWVDPFLVDGSLWEFRIFRGAIIAINAIVFGLTWTRWGKEHFIALGTFVGMLTGVGVIVLTEMTGGPSSPYWTMLMLTFFGITLILPQRPLHAGVSYLSVALFYVYWMKTMAPEVDPVHWAVSLAGILLSIVVSVAGTTYLAEYRRREDEIREELLQVNEQLIKESQERERAEALVQRTQQLDAVGRLGAGLAHELNNLLAVISGSAESIQHNPDRAPICAERILKSAQMGAKLTSNLLVFARESARESSPIELKSVISSVSDMLLRTYPRRLVIELEGFDRPIWVEGDSQLLSQAILNLCLNGAHAMNDKGTLLIRATSDDPERVRIDIIDEGCGMSPEVLGQAIEPFFTTRAPGKGSGLGLSMAYGTVRDHHGSMTLSSEEGIGTTVQLEFPTFHPKPEGSAEFPPLQPIPHEERPEENRFKKDLHIMLVDDDNEVRAVISDMLTLEGCTVVSVDSGDQALALYQSQTTPVDLVVLDRMMPGISGEETFMELRKHAPALPILMYSGLTMDGETNVLKGQISAAFLQKPFSRNMLLSSIQNLITNTP